MRCKRHGLLLESCAFCTDLVETQRQILLWEQELSPGREALIKSLYEDA